MKVYYDADCDLGLLAGKTVAIACPKFDDQKPYLNKLAQILRSSGVAKLTVLRMEVPCCTGLSALAHQAAELAGRLGDGLCTTMPDAEVVRGVPPFIRSSRPMSRVSPRSFRTWISTPTDCA